MISQGINRPEIETHLREAVARILSLPSASVFVIDDAADTTSLLPPFASIRILPPNRITADVSDRWAKSLEYWRLTVASSADGTYSATILGNSFGYVASGNTATQIRNGLLAAMPSTADYTTVAAGTTSIDIASLVPGARLVVESTSVTVTQYRRSLIKVTSASVEMPVEVVCFGVPRSAVWDGKTMAEVLQAGLLDADATPEMRLAGHSPLRSRVLDMMRVTAGESERIGKLELILGTQRSYINTSVGHATEIPLTITEGP
jgi:hypothetical protein